MTHVGIEGLAARHREECATDHREGQRPGMPEIRDRGQGAERCEYAGRSDYSNNSKHPDHQEPDQHHRSKYSADEGGPLALDHEQHHENGHGERYYDVLQMRSIDLDAFNGAQNGNRRRDCAVAIKEGGADEPDHHHDCPPPALFGAARADQCEKREDATLSTIVRAHDENGVFDGNDDDQRPEDQRHDAEHRLRRDTCTLTGGFGRDAERIERARPDIAEYDAHACQRRRRPGARFGCRADISRRFHVRRRRGSLPDATASLIVRE